MIDNVFRNKEFIKISSEFVCVYANPEDTHGKIKYKDPKTGKKYIRCADCPTVNCEEHQHLAQNWSRAFFPGSTARTPVHFVINAEEDVVAIIKNGDFEQGMNHVPPKIVVAELKKLLKKFGKGLTEREYKWMVDDLAAAKAARARDKTPVELEKLLKVVALNRKIEGVEFARKRVKEIDAWARKKLAKVEPLVQAKKWEEALAALGAIAKTYPGTLTGAARGQAGQGAQKNEGRQGPAQGEGLLRAGAEGQGRGQDRPRPEAFRAVHQAGQGHEVRRARRKRARRAGRLA